MKHSMEELLQSVYRHYPRGISSQDPNRGQTEEHLRLVEARKRAGTDNKRWRAMLERLDAQFPKHSIENRSLHLPAGGWDAAYSACIHLPTGSGELCHYVGFFVSFLVPCYVVYSFRAVDDLRGTEELNTLRARSLSTVHFFVNDTMFVLPAGVAKPEYTEPPLPINIHRNEISFEMSHGEQPCVAWISRDIEATWGYERMPPEIGKVIVPDVATSARGLGEATLYNCLFSDDW